ncbi:hypothetical protein ACEPAI_6718 [Sanghuangporus weigelae]
MAPSARAKAAGVSASSFLDLKAELAKKESEFTKKVPPPEKGKGTVWARTNKGVAARAARDIAALAADRVTAESARAALERKTKIYEKLRKGKTGGLTEAQIDSLLVDFDSKSVDDEFSSDSEDADESLTNPNPTDEDDPIIEYEDEFGRVRTARRSEVPREYMPSAREEQEHDDDPFVVRNPVDHFPVFEPSAERLAELQKAAEEADKPLESHYDATHEVRAKGAAFYAFSTDEERRQREMEELRKAREETEKARRDTGALDVKPGESEGLATVVGDGEAKGKETAHSRAMEKRKREIEERRKLVEAKRRKLKGGDKEGGAPASAKNATERIDPFVSAEADANAKSRKSKMRRNRKAPASTPSANSADDFLAALEHDLIAKGK